MLETLQAIQDHLNQHPTTKKLKLQTIIRPIYTIPRNIYWNIDSYYIDICYTYPYQQALLQEFQLLPSCIGVSPVASNSKITVLKIKINEQQTQLVIDSPTQPYINYLDLQNPNLLLQLNNIVENKIMHFTERIHPFITMHKHASSLNK